MLQEILDLGFERVELGHGIRLSLMEGIQRYYDAGKVRFSTLHNFCPLPVEITRASPDCYQFSSHRESRARAGREAQLPDHRLRQAARRAAGGAAPGPRADRRLHRQARGDGGGGEHLSRKYVKPKLKAVEQREKKAPLYVQRSKDCLLRVVEYAAQEGHPARRGRAASAYEEIPSETEALDAAGGINAPDMVGYWHDFGHVQIKENLGFVDHAEWLARIAPRLLGGASARYPVARPGPLRPLYRRHRLRQAGAAAARRHACWSGR